MKLNPEFYSLVLESAPSMKGRKVFVDELAELDPNYEEQLRIIKGLGVELKKFRESGTERIYVKVIEAEETGETTSPEAVKAPTLPENISPEKEPAPVSTMSPSESPATETPPEEKAIATIPDGATAVFRAKGLTTSQSKKGSTIKLTPYDDSDALVAAKFAQKSGDAFLVFLKPAKPPEKKEPEPKKEPKKPAPRDTESAYDKKAPAPPAEPPVQDVEIPDDETPIDTTPATAKKNTAKDQSTIESEISDQVRTGELDPETAHAQRSLMTGGGAAIQRSGGGRPV